MVVLVVGACLCLPFVLHETFGELYEHSGARMLVLRTHGNRPRPSGRLYRKALDMIPRSSSTCVHMFHHFILVRASQGRRRWPVTTRAEQRRGDPVLIHSQ